MELEIIAHVIAHVPPCVLIGAVRAVWYFARLIAKAAEAASHSG